MDRRKFTELLYLLKIPRLRRGFVSIAEGDELRVGAESVAFNLLVMQTMEDESRPPLNSAQDRPRLPNRTFTACRKSAFSCSS